MSSTATALKTLGVGAAVVTGSVLAVNAASAQSTSQSDIVDRLSTELGVDAGQVQGVFDDIREERQAERAAEREERLDALVEEGTLTQAQRTELVAFIDELRAEKEELREEGLSRDEIREAMEDSRAEFEAWLAEEGITIDDIKPDRENRRGGFNKGFDADEPDNVEAEVDAETSSIEV